MIDDDDSTSISHFSKGSETSSKKTPSSKSKSISLKLPRIKKSPNIAKNEDLFEIDYVGTGTFQVSQKNLLHKRSIEIFKNSDALLSARGLHHRSKETFMKEIQNSNSVIVGLMKGEKVTSTKYKPSPKLLQPYFQRALANEKLNQIDKAIEDYSFCLKIDNRCAAAYFNRSGLYKTKGNFKAAIQDMNKAIEIEPSNLDFRNNRSLLFRESGMYSEALRDTLISRALKYQPDFGKSLEAGIEPKLEGDLVFSLKLPEDPIIVSLKIPKKERSDTDLEPIIDFLKFLKFFSSFSLNKDVFKNIARNVELDVHKKGKYIFREGQPGEHFYIILDGEVSIVKEKVIFEDNIETNVLVKMYRGQTFGETALESKGGVRTAGAIASQPTRLLSLHVDEYNSILQRYKSLIREEVMLVLKASPLFQDWEDSKISHLASFVVIRSYGANAEIMKTGDPVNNLIMIKSGIVKLVKNVPNAEILLSKKESTVNINELGRDEVPGLWVLEKNWKTNTEHSADSIFNDKTTTTEFTVGILGSGQVFGELAILDPNKPSPVTAISSTAVELYCFDTDVLLSLGARFQIATIKSLNESLSLHNPHPEKIGYYYRSKYNWEIRKSLLMSRIKKKN